MEALKDLMYAGLGLAKQAENQVKGKFDTLVEKGKQVDQEGKNLISDFFKTVDDQKTKLDETFDDQLSKIEDMIKKLKKGNDGK
jgi:polyhydroxyalkanoate synthesis regulator phasin